MSFALFLHEPRQLPARQLAEAFERCPSLTAADAERWAPGARGGVVATGLSREDAQVVARELGKLGRAVELVDDRWLTLPATKAVRRAKPRLAGFEVHDPYGGKQTLAWAQVVAVAAGVLRVGKNTRVGEAELGSRSLGSEYEEAVYEYQQSDSLVLDVISEEPLRRYRITADKFDFECLGKRKTARSNDNLVELLRDIVGYAGELAIAPGAQLTLEQGRATRVHRSPMTYDAELAWVLWRHRGPGAARHGEPVHRTEPYSAAGVETKTFTEGARAASAQRVLDSNVADHDRHMRDRRPVDMALAALGSVCVGWMVADDLAGDSPLYLAALLGVAALATPLLYPLVRSWRRREHWGG
jgi:hypothetical protein